MREMSSKDTDLFFQAGESYEGPTPLGPANLAKQKYRKPTNFIDADTIIIGSGLGGLALASLLAQQEGEKVLVLEANIVPGGCTHVHELDGYEFNSGLHSVGDLDPRVGRGMLRPTADLVTGGKLRWAKMPDVHEVGSFADARYDWHSSLEANLAWLDKQFAGQGDVRRYYKLEDAIERGSTGFGMAKLLPPWMPQGLRDLAYGAFGATWRKYMKRNAYAVLREELGFSQRLAGVFSYMYGNYGRTPDKVPFAVHAICLNHYRHGAYYPVGGPGQIAECIVPLVEQHGGQLAVSSPVERIVVQDGRAVGVRLADGTELRAKKRVVSDASAYLTYGKLLEPEVAQQFGYTERLAKVGTSPAHLYTFLGYDQAIDLPKHIVWRMPRYEDLDPYDISAGDNRYKLDLKIDGLPCYVIAPSSRDPIWQSRRPNTSTVIVLAEAGEGWLERCQKDPSFQQDLMGKAAEALRKVAEEEMPQLRGKTPSFVRTGVPVGCNPLARDGCSYGLEPSGPRFVEHAHWLHPRSAIKGLYITGQDAFAPGISGALMSARITYAAATGKLWTMV